VLVVLVAPHVVTPEAEPAPAGTPK
jgi:hypothetical protein